MYCKHNFFNKRGTLIYHQRFNIHYRYDMTRPRDFYWTIYIKGTLEDIRKSCLKKQFLFDRPPLLNIPLEDDVLDELHLMPRVTGECTIMFNFSHSLITIYQSVVSVFFPGIPHPHLQCPFFKWHINQLIMRLK